MGRVTPLVTAHALVPRVRYAPELVIVSAGFDAALGDPLGGMAISPAGYAHMTAQLQTLAAGKLVIALEGGYNLSSISLSSAAALRVLLGENPPAIAGGSARPEAMRDVEMCVRALKPYWKCLQPPLVASGVGGDAELERQVRHLSKKLKKLKQKRKSAIRGPWWHKYL